MKVLGSRGESEKQREIEAAAEKERLKAAAIAKAGDPNTLQTISLCHLSTGSSKRPPQGPRKEPRASIGEKTSVEGGDAEDDIDSDEEKRLGATDLGTNIQREDSI